MEAEPNETTGAEVSPGPDTGGEAGSPGNCDDADGDSVCDSVDVCPLGDDLVDADQNGFADACEQLLARAPGVQGEWRLIGAPNVIYFFGYSESPVLGPDNGDCAGVRIESDAYANGDLHETLLTAADTDGFAAFARCLTNGEDNATENGYRLPAVGGGGASLARETSLRDPAGAGPDLAGLTVLYALFTPEQNLVTEANGGFSYQLRWQWAFYGY